MTRTGRGRITAFTLLELLVSMAIFSLLMVLLVSMLDQSRRVWLSSSSRISSFREARIGFDALTRTLSQASLNPYWDYDNADSPQDYVRRSELRFVSGPGLLSDDRGTTHSVFFQAPLGRTTEEEYQGLETLFNSCGYYVEYADDSALRPDFLNGLVEPKTRFRLMQWLEPAEKWQLFDHTSGNPGYAAHDWFQTPIADGVDSHVIAENVIALVIFPKLPTHEDPSGNELAPSFSYDSAPENWPPEIPQDRTENQLPPIVQITMVTLDASSAARLYLLAEDPIQFLGLDKLFQKADRLAEDLESLTDSLIENRLRYRVFQSAIKIRGAKWSSNTS